MDALTEWLLAGTGVVLAAAALGVAAWMARATRTVGAPLLNRPASRRSHLLWILALLGTGALVVVSDLVPTPSALLVLGAAAALVASLPRSGDSVFGESGVRSGWLARRFPELEEWRLTGDHLRWRVGPRWFSSAVPPGHHGELRERLERECPDRESAFRY